MGGAVWDRLALALFCLAGVVRVVYLVQTHARSPVLDDPLADSRAIVDLARSIAAGNLQQSEPFYRAPLIPYLIAPLYALLRRPEMLIASLQIAGGLAGNILIWSLARSLHGPVAGFTALLLSAFFGPVVSHETKILSTPAAVLLSILSMRRLITARSSLAFAAGGALLGLGALAQPSLLLAAPMVAAAIAFDRGSRPRRLGREILPMLAGVLLAVAPATLHNLRAGDMVMISSNGGMTFYHGNNESSRWGLLEPSDRVGWGGNAIRQGEIDREVASRETGRTLRPSESSAYWFAEGARVLASAPLRAARLWGMKLVRFAGSHDYADNYSYAVEKLAIPSLRLFAVPFPLILLLGLAGLLLSPPRTRTDRVLIAFALVGLLTCLLFFVGSRYRCLSTPALAILAGRAVASWSGASTRRRVAGALAALAVAVAAVYPPGEAASLQDSMAAAQWAASMERTGRAGAERFYEQATEWDPANAVAWGRRAHIAEDRAGPADAIVLLSRGIGGGADGRLLRLERGLARTRAGDLAGAEEDFRSVLARAPDDPSAAFLLGVTLVRLGRDREAATVFALPQLERDPRALAHRGRIALRIDDYTAAAAHFDLLLSIEPTDESAAILRAAAWARGGDEARARAWLDGWLVRQGGCDPTEWTERLLNRLKAQPTAEPTPHGPESICETRVVAAVASVRASP